MEAVLKQLLDEKQSPFQYSDFHTRQSDKTSEAIRKLSDALVDIIPIIGTEGIDKQIHDKKHISLPWLIDICRSVSSDLSPEFLARVIIDASHLNDEARQQALLFDSLGESENALQVLSEVTPLLSTIRDSISSSDVDEAIRKGEFVDSVVVDLDKERQNLIRHEAIEAAQFAAMAKANYEILLGESSAPTDINTKTHTVARASHIEAKKIVDKAEKRAHQLMKRAQDAGAILDDDALAFLDKSQWEGSVGFGSGGLLNRTEQEIQSFQQSLLPEGTRKYYDKRGLPTGTIIEDTDGMERVIIPSVKVDESNLHQRLVIKDIISDAELARAFDGTLSLNPMQSETFEVAFHCRDNMLVCAPTGAGKTNVAMLTAVSHFRDAGVLGISSRENGGTKTIETGAKVIYVAPMKALAQEVVEKFSAKLKPLGLQVRELTGDMQLSRRETESANLIVTTPEKWDVITRKSGNDETSLGNQCGLLIIDEVHLLADERGAVIESVVSRLHRLVESRQRQVRIVALSATLPNYSDVAEFLQVPKKGLFYFGPEYRPVPLQQTFIGLRFKSKDRNLKEQKLNEACFDTVVESLKRGYQVMVFVHSRKGTGDTASALAELASKEGVLELAFVTAGKQGLMGDAYRKYVDKVQKSRNRQVTALFQYGMGIHHAGMLRSDRKLSEKMFHDGAIKVLCCTATLAWGINLPAHSIVIKGTDVYNPEKGGTVDLSILDVQQIFGRAGRPQFDSSGEATLITTHDAFQRYMDKLVRPIPIESSFTKQLADHLNAEVVSGTVSNLTEAAQWLKYTYLYIRMVGNPQAYGITLDERADDPTLHRRCLELVTNAAKLLDRTQMLRYDIESGNLGVTSNGRVAAHFYIQAESMETFQDIFKLNTNPNDQALFVVICSANEFRNMKLRQEEMDELQELMLEACPLQLKGSGLTDDGVALVTSHVDKAFVLMQAYISRAKMKSFTLVSDMNYIASNAGRVARALFEMCLNKKKSGSAVKLLRIAKSIESQFWWFQTPLRHFELELDGHIFSALEVDSGRRGKGSFDTLLELLELQPGEIANLCKCSRPVGSKIQSLIKMLPNLNVSCEIKPVTGSIVMFSISLKSEFSWHDRWHGTTQSFWVWVEDGENDEIYHHEHISLPKRSCVDPMILRFSMPLFSATSSHYNVRVIADGWVGVEQVWSIPLKNITLPTNEMLHTKLLNLTPLMKSALQNPLYEKLFSKIEVFNPIQTQLFHVLYHTDLPVLLGAPTASGKTIIAELALLRMKTVNPNGVCVYIAPLKSLARERLKEWHARFGAAPFNWVILELSGDTSYDQLVLQDADVLICTPEKWDLISRGWRGFVNTAVGDGLAIGKMFVKRVCLLVLDEVHLLGEDRGAVLEAIVNRTRYISQVVQKQLDTDDRDTTVEGTRILALSTALANAGDLADWIGIGALVTGIKKRVGLYNFKPSVRPVPTKIHIQGYQGKHYCPRMASMNKPCFATIKEKSASKPVLVFVGSRRQTRLTAFDIIKYAANDEDPKIFLNCTDDLIHAVAGDIHDESLRHVLTFGIGLHHAGLSKADREAVENLFIERKIQVLVATATLAWGVNLPAHLVIVKGTEYFDGKISRYVDYPITDVLQMVGRAGRPGFDTSAQAVVMVSEEKKDFYKKFLYNPFPVESCLGERLGEILNAEIAGGTISSFNECLGYLTSTFFARRVRANPNYYGAKSNSDEDVGEHFHNIITMTLKNLEGSECVNVNGDDESSIIFSTTLGIACANFYLKLMTPKQMYIGLLETQKVLDKVLADKSPLLRHPKISTRIAPFNQHTLVEETSCAWLLYVISSTHEFDEHPVRHNEEFLNEELCTRLMWSHDPSSIVSGSQGRKNPNKEVFKDPHTKCFLLLQAYLQRVRLPISDYINDTKAVIDQIPRLLAAMEFIAWKEISGRGSFDLVTQFSILRQLIETRSMVTSDPLEQLIRLRESDRQQLAHQLKKNETSPLLLSDLRSLPRYKARAILQSLMKESNQNGSMDSVLVALYDYPLLSEASAILSLLDNSAKLNLSMTLDRESGHVTIDKKRDSYSYSIIVCSMDERAILARETIRIHQFGKWEVNKELIFEWPDAQVNEGNRFLIIRFLLNEIRGLDFEMVVGVSDKSSTN